VKHLKESVNKMEESEDLIMSHTLTKEFEIIRKELTLVKEKDFQFMISTNLIRNEFKHVIH